MSTIEILSDIRDSLESLCERKGWTASVAKDPIQVYEILLQVADSGVAVVAYEGEQVHQQAARNAVSRTNFSIAVSCRRDPTDALGGQMTESVGLIEMIDAIKARVMALEIPNGLEDDASRYVGTQPMAMPDGAPLDAYKISFWCWTQAVAETFESSSQSSEVSSD